MLHAATELRFINKRMGLGVFATAFIPQGTITWVRCKLDRAFSPAETAALDAPYQSCLAKYAYTNGMGYQVLCWDQARYMNHSCEATCISPGFDCDIALRDIAPGDELTNDYAMFNLDEVFACECGKRQCRGRIDPGDGAALASGWDAAVAAAFKRTPHVDQPLLSLMLERDEMTRTLRGERQLPSTRRQLVYGKERPTGARVQRSGSTFSLVATQPLEPGDTIMNCEGPTVADGVLSEEERARAVIVKARGVVVPRNDARFIARAPIPNVALDDDGTVRVIRAIAPGETITLSDAKE